MDKYTVYLWYITRVSSQLFVVTFIEMSSKIMRFRSRPEENTLGPTFYHTKMFGLLLFSKLKFALRIDSYKFRFHCWPEMPDTFKFGSHKILPYVNTETNISPSPYCFNFLLSLQVRIWIRIWKHKSYNLRNWPT